MAKKKHKKKMVDRRVNDLSTYMQDIEKFDRYCRENVKTIDDVVRLLREFDEQQEKEWKKHTVD